MTLTVRTDHRVSIYGTLHNCAAPPNPLVKTTQCPASLANHSSPASFAQRAMTRHLV